MNKHASNPQSKAEMTSILIKTLTSAVMISILVIIAIQKLIAKHAVVVIAIVIVIKNYYDVD